MRYLTLDEMASYAYRELNGDARRLIGNSLNYIAKQQKDQVRKVRKREKSASGHNQSYLVSSYPHHYQLHFNGLCTTLMVPHANPSEDE